VLCRGMFAALLIAVTSLSTQVPAHEPTDKREIPVAPATDDTSPPPRKSDAALDAPMTAAGSASTPQGRTLGLGLQLGYPTSLTVKYMVQPDQGLIGGIGGLSAFAYSDPALTLHVDYVYHPTVLTSSDAFAVTWFIGGGGQIIVNNNPSQRAFFPDLPYYRSPTQLWLAARLPVGVALSMMQQPFEIYLEADPSLLVFPSLGFGIGASIGARFYL
jgi:hypothetical protein